MGGEKEISGSVVAFTVSIILLAVILAGFMVRGIDTEDDGKIQVIVSILPQAEFARAVGGDRLRITTMVPYGQEPHMYEPTPSQMKAIENAQIYFKVGSGIDFELVWMGRFEDLNDEMVVIDGSSGVTLIPMQDSDEGAKDPHIWLSPENAKIMVSNFLSGMIQVDPANESEYRGNAESYSQQLNELDQDISSALTSLENRMILVYHPAWGYFAERYDLQQLPIEEGGTEPTIQNIVDAIDIATENGIEVIFASPQFSIRTAEQIADEIDGIVVLVDPLAEDYISNLENITEEISGGTGGA